MDRRAIVGLFGAKKRRTREIAHEVLRPLGVDTKDLTDRSAHDLTGHLRRIVERDQDGELYNRQKGWRKDE